MAIDPKALTPKQPNEMWLRYEPQKTFPTSVTLGQQTITMHADGRIEGDPEAFRKEMENLTGEGFGSPILWLVWRELVRQKEGK